MLRAKEPAWVEGQKKGKRKAKERNWWEGDIALLSSIHALAGVLFKLFKLRKNARGFDALRAKEPQAVSEVAIACKD